MPFLIMIIIAFHDLLSSKEKKRLLSKRILVFGISAIVFVLFMATKYVPEMISVVSVISKQTTLEENYYSYVDQSIDDISIQAEMEVADFLEKNTDPDEKIYIWGFEPVIYVLAKRRCVSRFIYNVPLYWEWSPPEFKQEFLEDMRRESPKYFIVVSKDILYRVTGNMSDSKDAFEKFLELKQIISDKYEFSKEIEYFTLYKLK
jgi:hypothetical protein